MNVEHTHHDDSSKAGAAARVKDPVCGMEIDPTSARGGAHVHAGKTYCFCNPKCRAKFAAEPEKYLGANRASATADVARDGTAYVCPMDPDVRQDHPGP